MTLVTPCPRCVDCPQRPDALDGALRSSLSTSVPRQGSQYSVVLSRFPAKKRLIHSPTGAHRFIPEIRVFVAHVHAARRLLPTNLRRHGFPCSGGEVDKRT